MTVQLMITCLADSFYGEVARDTVYVLEAAGHTVRLPNDQTCCGQPPFNAGDRKAAVEIAEQWAATFDPTIPVVTPSGSCAAMCGHGYHLLLKDRAPHHKVYELSGFLLESGLPSLKSEVGTRVAIHRSCHSRQLSRPDALQELLMRIPGVVVVPVADSEQCCGFGGAFSINHPTVSAGIGREKLANLTEANADAIVTTDLGCLMHLNGLADKRPVMHIATFLKEHLA
ncbi:MAG: Lactate utilization protein A [Fimbriimonadaceae bacterium]|nr:Lactate utilization protein A [Fimbriimonadaceae bacterium]